jgi:hypothetical protein
MPFEPYSINLEDKKENAQIFKANKFSKYGVSNIDLEDNDMFISLNVCTNGAWRP